jgi:hypothetical protein
VLHQELPDRDFFRKTVGEFLTEMTVKFHCVHNCPSVEQRTGKSPVTRSNLKHTFAFYISKVCYTIYRMRIGKKMLIMMRFHRVVNT